MKKKNAKNTKGKIVSAAWKLFYEQGYDNTTVEEIVEASGTSRGSFYHYFEGKDALLSSDSMEADWFSDIGTEFQGLPYRTDILCKALNRSLEQHLVPEYVRADLCQMVQEQI